MGALPLPTPLPAQPAETSREKHASTVITVFNIFISWMAKLALLHPEESLHCSLLRPEYYS